MEDLSRFGRTSHHRYSSALSKQRRSGYEPSDTETEWPPIPRNERLKEEEEEEVEELFSKQPKLVLDLPRNTSLFKLSRRTLSSRFETEGSSSSAKNSTQLRHNSKSTYKLRVDDNTVRPPLSGSDFNGNINPFSKFEGIKHFNLDKEGENEKLKRIQSCRKPTMEEKKANYKRRSVTAPRLRSIDNEKQSYHGHELLKGKRTPSPLLKGTMTQKQKENTQSLSVGEINEMIANAKIRRGPIESTESISPGDIFFSRDCLALELPNSTLPNNDGFGLQWSPSRLNSNFENNNNRGILSTNGLSQTNITNSSSAINRQNISSVRSGLTGVSGRSSSESLRNFTANRRASQAQTWFACMRNGTCRSSKSPEKRRHLDEVGFIKKSLVVEKLPQFWADKHQPKSLNGFIFHRQEAQLLKQLVSNGTFPHILLKGPTGSGKRALAMALLCEIYGDACCNISHSLRCFVIQETRPMQVVVPITSSIHHLELNVHLQPNSRYALMALVKEINKECTVPQEISNVNFKAKYKVIVLYDVDKAAKSIQHLIKWILDRYSETCKLILCCEDDTNVIESVKSLCKDVKVDAPVTHEIIEVLIQIARKEDIDLPMSFAAKIAAKSKQNLRRSIMALEACKAHYYPFGDDQPIQLGWEEVVIELAEEVLGDPSHKRLLLIRGKLQKLLMDFVHPKLILLKLVEQFLKGIDSSLKRELFYWHAYYDKRIPTGTTAMLKLEEFLAKFMSIYRKSYSARHQ